MNPEWTAEQQRLYKVFELAIDDLIQFAAPKVPALGNKGKPELVDMAGRQNELRKFSDKVEKTLKEIISSKIPDTETEARGEAYVMKVEGGIDTTRLDQTAAKEMLEKVGAAVRELRKLGSPVVDRYIGVIPDEPLQACMVTSSGSRRTFSKVGP